MYPYLSLGVAASLLHARPVYPIISAMSRTCSINYGLLPALLLMYCLPGLAATVYRTVDEHGVVSFSDIRPADDAPVETLVIDARAPQVSEAQRQRLQDMRDTTDRMATDRMAREKHRAELRQLQAQTQAQYQYPSEYPVDYNPRYLGYSSGYSGYYNYPARRPWKRRHRPKPVHPIARPPLRLPAQGHNSAIRTSLPGNNYPASLIRKSYDPKVRAALRN
ncbi:MAG: hypothetical protein DRQ65_06950 [Gammaproteobacteria bacterium]|nr:MAG: hypothetical protein DRQ65_06950 [Gammaproteobacteria bacterium]RLA56393.1 MAG: hypothetical protein DRQ98_02265 [Gammaproteobacteria bacterium]HDY83006.1 DUF4124 domain-containing protein [Halieaceae bacterium]